MPIKKIVILFSGTGTNLENLIKKLHQKAFDGFKIEVVHAITNNPEAKGIEKAKRLNIKTTIIDHKKFNAREDFDKEVVTLIKSLNVDLTILAGFMRILTPIFTENIKAINIHPSLLPLFKGANAIEKSYLSNMKIAGVTIHKVSSGVDEGEIIDQECFYKNENISIDDFEKKIHQIEYTLFPKAVIKVLSSS